MTLVQTAIKDIYIGAGTDDYSAMQGPCPDGFHVPSINEWSALLNIFTSIGLVKNGTTMQTYMKMPFASYRSSIDASIFNLGASGDYWSYTPDDWKIYKLSFIPNGIYLSYTTTRAAAQPIRAFKNTPVTPDSSWTSLYSNRIYHSSSLGLISLSSNGTNWITIADKNLGATTVYNSGDTLSQANCGKYYQWGNNYGFPFSGSITTSSTKVDASNYGPGNYYSSSTFITVSSTPYDWSSVQNDNLWGGETGVVKKGVSKVYIGSTQVRPEVKTYTIVRNETSDPSQFFVRYEDDAVGLTPGDSAFDEFFGYSAVKLSTSGVETAEVKQSSPGVLDITQLGTLNSGDNVMIKFPRLGIKMSKSGSVVTLSITNKPDAEADGFQYYAHSRGTLSSPIKKDALYLGAFKAYNSSNVLKSWSGQSPVVSITQQNCINYARANDGNTGSAGYDIIGFYQREFINALYMMKYGNPDCQSVIGRGYTEGSAKVNTGGTVSQTSATYGTTSATQQVKLFGLEDWWGNVGELIGGMCTDGSKLWTALSGFVGYVKTTSPYENTGTTIQHTGSGYNLSSIVGSNKGLFAPIATVSNSNSDTYYCDRVYVNASSTAAVTGASYSGGSAAGVFSFTVARVASSTDAKSGARLMFL